MNRDFVKQIVITGRAKSVGPENSISDPATYKASYFHG